MVETMMPNHGVPWRSSLAKLCGNSPSRAAAKGISARELIGEASGHIGGGGGGSDEMAQAGGKNAEGVDAALEAARKYLESH